jgi:hypothetical protein
VKLVDPDGEASILLRVINKDASSVYDVAHELGKRGIKAAMHSLVARGDSININNVVQYSGEKSGFTRNDNNAQDKHYTVVYSGMDNDLTDLAIDKVLKLERFGSGNNAEAKEKYQWFSNNCQDFTNEVFMEYSKLWKEREGKKHSGLFAFLSIEAAWQGHLAEITKDAGKVLDLSSP